MRPNWKKTAWPLAGCVLAIGLIPGQMASAALGADFKDTANNGQVVLPGQPYEGNLLDTATNLVWGKDIDVRTIKFFGDRRTSEWADGTDEDPVDESQTGGYRSYSEDNPGGWRTPTVTEVLEALSNGLRDHLDFSYDEGLQAWDDLLPGEPEGGLRYGDQYFWTACIGYHGRRYYRYQIRYSDGYYERSFGEAFSIIPVRYAGDLSDPNADDPDHSSCPKRCQYRPKKPPKK